MDSDEKNTRIYRKIKFQFLQFFELSKFEGKKLIFLIFEKILYYLIEYIKRRKEKRNRATVFTIINYFESYFASVTVSMWGFGVE